MHVLSCLAVNIIWTEFSKSYKVSPGQIFYCKESGSVHPYEDGGSVTVESRTTGEFPFHLFLSLYGREVNSKKQWAHFLKDFCTPWGVNDLSKQEAVLKATAVRSPLLAGNVVDSSMSSLSSLRGGGSGGGRESGRQRGVWWGEGGWGEGKGAGDILIQLPYTALPHGASP